MDLRSGSGCWRIDKAMAQLVTNILTASPVVVWALAHAGCVFRRACCIARPLT
ncbi:MAG: hypothetical protein Q8Q78_09280 [Hydrogenophaga sp.]|nr:hypothetical protein [Hydrogenophaga sp.]